jgi:hypothetical protein
MGHYQDTLLFKTGLSPSKIYEKSFTKYQKLENYEDLLASRKTSDCSKFSNEKITNNNLYKNGVLPLTSTNSISGGSGATTS